MPPSHGLLSPTEHEAA
jgi:hypothetical protein